jgi:hypothetical protein
MPWGVNPVAGETHGGSISRRDQGLWRRILERLCDGRNGGPGSTAAQPADARGQQARNLTNPFDLVLLRAQ